MFLVAPSIMKLRKLIVVIVFSCQWLRKTNRKPLFAAVEKMKEGIICLCTTNLEHKKEKKKSPSNMEPQILLFLS